MGLHTRPHCPSLLEDILKELMTNENQTKWVQARLALKALGLTPMDFIDLDMAMCIKVWEDDLGPLNMTPEELVEMHEDYHIDLCARALKL